MSLLPEQPACPAPFYRTREISEEEVLNFLQKRTGILEGVCISGGEPTLSADLEPFVRKIHEMGYSVKLDTNGSHPEVLKNLAEKNLIQMAAVVQSLSPKLPFPDRSSSP